MGAAQRTVKNVWVYKIDPARNLMFVRGQVLISNHIYLFTCAQKYFKGRVCCLALVPF